MLIYVDPCKWPAWVLLYERAGGISFTSMALSAHTFMPMKAFCLDVEKPSVDWHVLQMSVFFVNVLLISVQILYNHLKSGSLSSRNKLQRESVALTTASLPLWTRLSLYSPFSPCPPLSALRKPKHRVACPKEIFLCNLIQPFQGTSVRTFCSVQRSGICICSHTWKNNSPLPTGDIQLCHYKAY